MWENLMKERFINFHDFGNPYFFSGHCLSLEPTLSPCWGKPYTKSTWKLSYDEFLPQPLLLIFYTDYPDQSCNDTLIQTCPHGSAGHRGRPSILIQGNSLLLMDKN
jgi:hypothetical protein